jgi:metallo-beta-lactamase family protein
MTVSRESRVGIIASFAVARAQTLLTLIHEFYERHPEEKVRIVFDSPMMKHANRVYQQYSHMTSQKDSVYTALDEADAIEYQREWDSLKRKHGPLIIISSSGMLTGGRISRHLYNWKDDDKAILFLPGYQGEGTPGRSLVEGNRLLKTQDGTLFTWTGEVWTSEAFSSHADQSELLTWISTRNKNTEIYLLHGEPEAKKILSEKLISQGLHDIHVPVRDEIIQV